jgi:hypothetical protein
VTVTRIELYPTGDIHLLLNGPAGPTVYQLLVRDEDLGAGGVQADLSASQRTEYETFLADDFRDIVDISRAGRITPLARGEAFCRIRHTDTDAAGGVFVNEIVVRIRVHDDLDVLWLGNNQATLYRNEDNYVLSVYARFTDGTLGDVSSHPYLTFSSAQPAKVAVNDTDDKGRLRGVGETGSDSVAVTVRYKSLSSEVDVRVGPPVDRAPRVVTCIHGKPAEQDRRRNLVLLAEGFTADQQALFRYIVRLTIDRLFTAGLNAPFPLLKDAFNVWVVFDASSEEGVTPGSLLSKAGDAVGDQPILRGWPLPIDLSRREAGVRSPTEADEHGNYSLRQLVSYVGLPDRYRPLPSTRAEARAAWAPIALTTDFDTARVTDAIVDFWLAMREYHLMQARDSRFGLIQGYRYGDRFARLVDPALPRERVMRWYLPLAARSGSIDRRRQPRNWSRFGFQDRYLDSLPGMPLANRVVVYVANLGYDVGNSFGAIALSVRREERYFDLTIAGPRTDHALSELVPMPSFADVAGASVERIAAVLAHELGHTLGILGDEYEGFDYEGAHDVLLEDDTEGRERVQGWDNLTHHYATQDLAGDPDDIDIHRAKWSRWHRIRTSSVLAGTAEQSSNGLKAPVSPGERPKWLAVKQRGTSVFLRTLNINFDDPINTWSMEGPLRIDDVRTDGTIVMVGPVAGPVDSLEVLYEPEVGDDGQPLTVFDPAVVSRLSAPHARPFAQKTDASQGSRDPGYPPEGLFLLHPRFNPADLASVVGVYEGGGTYNTRAYRPSGICKMRQTRATPVEARFLRVDPSRSALTDAIPLGPPEKVTRHHLFCYVCQYALTNRLDPTRLNRLDYPR